MYFIQDTGKGKLSEKAYLKHGKSSEHNGTKITKYKVKFRVEPDFGIPGAFLIKNEHKHKFFLQSATLEVPANQSIQFNCKSWIYPFTKTKTNRLFFSNTVSKHIKFGYWQNPFKCNKKTRAHVAVFRFICQTKRQKLWMNWEKKSLKAWEDMELGSGRSGIECMNTTTTMTLAILIKVKNMWDPFWVGQIHTHILAGEELADLVATKVFGLFGNYFWKQFLLFKIENNFLTQETHLTNNFLRIYSENRLFF